MRAKRKYVKWDNHAITFVKEGEYWTIEYVDHPAEEDLRSCPIERRRELVLSIMREYNLVPGRHYHRGRYYYIE